jgi:hypothetical protein
VKLNISFKSPVFWILLIGAVGRLCVSIWASDANDDHAEVVLLILENDSFPDKDSCWECFQPPLFYYFHAGFAKLHPFHSVIDIHRQMQWFNLIASLLLLALIHLYIKRIDLDPSWKYILLAFFAWSPRMAAVGIQATNDGWVFLLSGLFCWQAYKYLEEPSLKRLAKIILWASLACIIKGNGILLMVAFTGFMVLSIPIQWSKKHLVKALTFWIMAVGVSALAGGYVSKYQKYHDPFAINQPKAAPPPLWEDEVWFEKRPGIRSVRSGYFSFPFGSLIETPYQVNDQPEYPKHRTSFFALLYANFYHAQFASHPWKWRLYDYSSVNNLARALFILGLFPFLIFIWGFLIDGYNSIKNHFSKNRTREQIKIQFEWMMFVLVLVFVFKYSYDFRDFGNIKAMFLFPAFLPMIGIFKRGLQRVFKLTEKPPHWVAVLFWSINILLILDVLFLILQLIKGKPFSF